MGLFKVLDRPATTWVALLRKLGGGLLRMLFVLTLRLKIYEQEAITHSGPFDFPPRRCLADGPYVWGVLIPCGRPGIVGRGSLGQSADHDNSFCESIEITVIALAGR